MAALEEGRQLQNQPKMKIEESNERSQSPAATVQLLVPNQELTSPSRFHSSGLAFNSEMVQLKHPVSETIPTNNPQISRHPIMYPAILHEGKSLERVNSSDVNLLRHLTEVRKVNIASLFFFFFWSPSQVSLFN